MCVKLRLVHMIRNSSKLCTNRSAVEAQDRFTTELRLKILMGNDTIFVL